MYKFFDMDLYFKIRDARKEAGLTVASLSKDVDNHPLVCRKLYSRVKYKEYTIESVKEHWYNGWFEVLLLVDNKGSHRVIFWKSINCKDEIILKNIDKTREEFYYINDKGVYVKELN
jgi:hypothetical protein